MPAQWRVARSLDVLLGQLNELAPNRNKASDGSIGDTDHQNRSSDHNPWYGPGIVTARDFTHDPAGGLDCDTLAATLVAHRDPRIKYIIRSRRIWQPNTGWRAYTGANPHTSHLHLSVVASPLCDNTAPWAGFNEEVREMELDDPMGGGPQPLAFPSGAPAEANSVRRCAASTYSYAKDGSQRTARLETAVSQLRAEVQELKGMLAELLTGGFTLGATGQIVVAPVPPAGD